tara:strand:- start:860 stop:1423 length:564 start_codon:yes stop_codon:yes gene_type:complete
MAISGTKTSSASTTKNYFVNDCTIKEVEVMDSQYTDMSLKLQLEDNDNGYSYTCFVNQQFSKDNNGVVTGMLFPEDLNTLFLATKCDLNVSDSGVLDTKSLESLMGKEVSCITYQSTGKYKRNTWGVVSHPDEKSILEKKFIDQVKKGYPKDFKKPSENDKLTQDVMETLINNDAGHDKASSDDIKF